MIVSLFTGLTAQGGDPAFEHEARHEATTGEGFNPFARGEEAGTDEPVQIPSSQRRYSQSNF